MALLKLKPATKDYLWGGHRLAEEYGVEDIGPVLAEAWEVSCHPDGPSIIENGEYAGKSLQEFIDAEGTQVMGTNCERFLEFPILTKFIDAKDNLSIQVHPDNAYALKNEGQYGKTEMWYILDAEPGAFLYYGFKKEISKEEFAQRIQDNTLLEVLNAVPVHKGDTFFIKSGTLHAIGKGILIAEIQQNSNVTYRIYDYARVGKDGKQRELHVDKSLDVTNRAPAAENDYYPHLGDCDYFTVDKLNLDGKVQKSVQGMVDETSFLSVLILDGNGTIQSGDESLDYKKGDSFFLSANSGDWKIEGVCDALLTTIRVKEDAIHTQVEVNGNQAQITLSDIDSNEVAKESYDVDSSNLIEELSNKISSLFESKEIPFDRCTLIEVSGASSDDSFKEEFEKVILCPVKVK